MVSEAEGRVEPESRDLSTPPPVVEILPHSPYDETLATQSILPYNSENLVFKRLNFYYEIANP